MKPIYAGLTVISLALAFFAGRSSGRTPVDAAETNAELSAAPELEPLPNTSRVESGVLLRALRSESTRTAERLMAIEHALADLAKAPERVTAGDARATDPVAAAAHDDALAEGEDMVAGLIGRGVLDRADFARLDQLTQELSVEERGELLRQMSVAINQGKLRFAP